jgi:EF hand
MIARRAIFGTSRRVALLDTDICRNATRNILYQCNSCQSSFRCQGQVHRSTCRYFSDRAMGYSPMAPHSYNPQILNLDSKEIPTEKDVEIAGNIFATQSNKREKLGELKVEALANDILSLDDAATDEQKLDLWLVDGLIAIASDVDSNRLGTAVSDTIVEMSLLHELVEYCNNKVQSSPSLNQLQWEEYLVDVGKQIDRSLCSIPSDRCLRNVRDFYDTSKATLKEEEKSLLDTFDDAQVINNQRTSSLFQQSVIRFRLLQTREAVKQLQKDWKTLTTWTDQDIDRAAVKQNSVEEVKEISTAKLNAVLSSYVLGSCKDRFDSMWSLMDKDNDGLLDEEELVHVCNMVITPTGEAVRIILQESIDAYPLRAPLQNINDIDIKEQKVKSSSKEKKAKKRLLKLFNRNLKNHFLTELELSHRLRCSYAWANKTHQDNRVDSVLVDDSGWSGRKRYVELKPKIALPEFREVQAEHIKHLDRISAEYLQSFREDLLLDQGKGRQNKEVMRDCFLFMTAVCVIDFIIMTI